MTRKFKLFKLSAAIVIGALFAMANSAAIAQPNRPKLDQPILACAGSTQASIYIQVTAGASGAPAGFSLQWRTAADYALYGWNESELSPLCHGSFSGNANLSRYELVPGGSVFINIGELLFDNGASTNCPDALLCGTEYVFRAFAHATNTKRRSDFTADHRCSTLACGSVGQCTYTQGYWKTHGPIPTGNNSNEWPVASLTLGSVSYTDLELQSILNKPAAGNGLIVLAHQLIAAKLNIENGADPTAVAAAVAAADALIGGLVVPPVGAGYLRPAATSNLVTILTAYNEGAIGPGHCD